MAQSKKQKAREFWVRLYRDYPDGVYEYRPITPQRQDLEWIHVREVLPRPKARKRKVHNGK